MILITPVGTSLFTNYLDNNSHNFTFGRNYKRIKNFPASDWDKHQKSIRDLEKDSTQFIRNKTKSASAELQSIAKIQNALKDDINVRLLVSDTIASRLAAEILMGNVAAKALDNKVNKVTVNFDANDVVKGLQVTNSKDFLKEGMISLIKRLESIHEKYKGQGHELAINITGGYGATLPYLTIFAQVKRVSLYYNFEDSNELIKIPPVPLVIDWDLIGPHFEILQKIDEGEALEQWKEFESRNHKAVQVLQPFILVDENDDSAYLSPLAKVFWNKCLELQRCVTWPEPVDTSPEDKNALSGEEHHRPTGWENFVDRLCKIVYVSQVSYHGTGTLDKNEGEISVKYTFGGKVLPLRVATSAHGKAQTELVEEYINRHL